MRPIIVLEDCGEEERTGLESGKGMPKQVGSQNSKRLLRHIAFGSFNKLCHTRVCLIEINYIWLGCFAPNPIDVDLGRQLGSSPSNNFADRIVMLMSPSIFWSIEVLY